jgi:hypothetical protein
MSDDYLMLKTVLSVISVHHTSAQTSATLKRTGRKDPPTN